VLLMVYTIFNVSFILKVLTVIGGTSKGGGGFGVVSGIVGGLFG